MASTSILFFTLLISFSSAQPFTNAVEILSGSSYKFMSRALNSASNSALSKSPSLTVFAPDDEVFTNSGQPGPILLHYHLLPVNFLLVPRSRLSLSLSAQPSLTLDLSRAPINTSDDPTSRSLA